MSELKNFFNFEVLDSEGKKISLSNFAGKYVLVVNVASKCGFTNQYTGLEKLYKNLNQKNVVVLGFPCNQFGSQEPGSNEEIQSFCSLNYSVTFPILAKIEVNGSNTAPVYQFMKSSIPGILGTEAIKWNFTKFLISPTGKVLKRYAPQTEPETIESDIIKLMES